MKQTATFRSSNFLSISLCIGLVSSLLLNIYQLYRHNEGWLHYAEAQYTEADANQLRAQLQVCRQEATRKDSVIAVLKQGATTNPYPTLSAHNDP